MHNKIVSGRIFQIIVLCLLVAPFTIFWGYMGSGIATGLAGMVLAVYSTISILKEGRKEVFMTHNV